MIKFKSILTQQRFERLIKERAVLNQFEELKERCRAWYNNETEKLRRENEQ